MPWLAMLAGVGCFAVLALVLCWCHWMFVSWRSRDAARAEARDYKAMHAEAMAAIHSAATRMIPIIESFVRSQSGGGSQ